MTESIDESTTEQDCQSEQELDTECGAHHKISVTAKLVAFFRQFSDIPFAKDVAEFVGAEAAFQKILEDTGLQASDLKEFSPVFEARYKSIVNVIANSGINQVLELASGFSLRGFAMTRAASLTYIESDLRELNSEKLKLLAELSQHKAEDGCGNHSVATVNALVLSELQEAVRQLDKNLPLIVVHEGLVQYFSKEERELLAKNIRALLAEFAGGCWITPDFSFRAEVDNVSAARQQLRQAVMGVTARTLYESAFEGEEGLQQFFIDSGFQGELHYQVDETPNFTSLEKWQLPPAILEKLKKRLRLWVLKPVS
ncbi:MAG TPA: class I SAM-dependent methyltransferase [Oculatellaceae cyanobacterium]